MVYSASSYLGGRAGNHELFLIRQVVYNAVGFFLMFMAYTINIRLLHRRSFLILAMVVSTLLLVAVLFFGQEINGARAWIDLGVVNIQPAEITKLVSVWFLAYYLRKQMHHINDNFWKSLAPPALFLGFSILLIMAQPDMGSVIIISFIAFVMVLASGVSWQKSLNLALAALAIVLVGFLLIRQFGEVLTFIPDYQLDRFRAFFDPFGYSQTAGHQLVNSYLALSRGGLRGVGIGNSVQKSGYLPEPHTDFIMAITAEELGLIITLVVIFTYYFLTYRISLLAIRSKSSFHSLFTLGIAAYFFIQGTVNLGGVIGLLPITGVTFPFVSFGGSSLVISHIMIGLILNVSRNEKRGVKSIGPKSRT